MSRRRRKRLGRDGSIALPMAPMIDIVFQLIAFFLFALSFNPLSREVQPPESLPGQQSRPAGRGEFVVEIDREGKLLTGQGPVAPDAPDYEERLAAVFAARGEEAAVVIRADRTAPYGAVGRVLRWCQTQKIPEVGLQLREAQ